MINYIYRYDLLMLFRAKWIQALLLIFLFLFLFAGYNGKQQTIARTLEIEKAKTEVASNDAKMGFLLDSIERGLTITSEPYWALPNDAAAVGNNYPRVAYKAPSELSFIAVGQSDIYTHTVKPTLRSDAANLNFTELKSSVNLLFGSFDIAFAIIYLLPLIIIALSYNILSYEREHGSLMLLASQPISIFNWTLKKVLVRYLSISAIILLTLFITFLVNGVSIIENFTGFIWLGALSLLYALFWFGVAFAVNMTAGSSAKNAITLLGVWVFFGLLVPSVLNLSANTIYPVPSRTALINDMRSVKAEASKRQDEVLDSYLRDHPEYALRDSTSNYSFWHTYFASQKMVIDAIAPKIQNFDMQLKNQQTWVNKLRFLSPAIIVQRGLTQIAGTSSDNYSDFRYQVLSFTERWRAHHFNFIYNNEMFAKKDMEALPEFIYEPLAKKNLLLDTLILLVASAIIFFMGWILFRKTLTTGKTTFVK